jgi:LmbE family N-acetylglucosaminyl deacetylase
MVQMPLRILAVGAHPDDLEILCGGTLARLSARGDHVAMCHALNGNLGHFEIPRSELREIRREEAKRAASLIGARSITLDIDDLDLYVERSAKLRMMDVIRETAPDLTILPAPNDYMPDHSVAATVGLDAGFMASLPQLPSIHAACSGPGPVYFSDTVGGLGFDPEEFVDISMTAEVKREMIACHRSQADWLKKHDNIDYVEFAMLQSAFRGLQSGVRFAEAFRPFRVFGRVATSRLLP